MYKAYFIKSTGEDWVEEFYKSSDTLQALENEVEMEFSKKSNEYVDYKIVKED